MSATTHAIPEPADVSVSTFMGSLRASLGLPPDEPHPEEDAATPGRALPDVVEGLDPGAWLAWAQAGLLLFSGGTMPSVRNAASAGRRVALALAMRRTAGNISASAKALQTSRKVMREQLRAEGLYPWARRRIRPWMATS